MACWDEMHTTKHGCKKAVVMLALGELGEPLLEPQNGCMIRALLDAIGDDVDRTACQSAEDVEPCPDHLSRRRKRRTCCMVVPANTSAKLTTPQRCEPCANHSLWLCRG